MNEAARPSFSGNGVEVTGLRAFVDALKTMMMVRTVVLFGSRARGENLPDSDYDLLVVSDDLAPLNRLRRREKLLEAWERTDLCAEADADLFGLTRAELLSMETPVVWDMLEDGRPLLDDGTWEEATAEFRRRKAAGYIVAVEGGWKIAEGPWETDKS